MWGEVSRGRGAKRVGREVFLLPGSDPLGSLPGPSLARFEWLGTLGSWGQEPSSLSKEPSVLSAGHSCIVPQIFVEHLVVCQVFAGTENR